MLCVLSIVEKHSLNRLDALYRYLGLQTDGVRQVLVNHKDLFSNHPLLLMPFGLYSLS